MPSQESSAPVQSFTQRLASWFDLESAALVTILLGIFQVMLSVPLAYISPENMPKLFVLPLVIGILVITGGSLAMANERNPNRYLLQGCACTNAISLLGALIAFCLYSINIHNLNTDVCEGDDLSWGQECVGHHVVRYSFIFLLLLLVYDMGAIVLNCTLSAVSVRELKKD